MQLGFCSRDRISRVPKVKADLTGLPHGEDDSLGSGLAIGALINRIGFWGTLY